MYKTISFILLIVIAVVGAVVVFRRPTVQQSAVVTQPAVVAQTPATTQTSSAKATTVATPTTSTTDTNLSQSKNGIDVTIVDVAQRDQATVLTLALNNHSVDLGQDAIYEVATLDGKFPQSHTFLSNATGGHHVEVEMVFEKTTTGSFKITPVDQTTFSFDDLW